jgi:parallel beta-helix repeat protein
MHETAVVGNIVYVDPAAKANGIGTIARPFNSWSGISFQPGTTYLQLAGTTSHGNLVIGNSATGASPIQIGSYGNGLSPVIAGSVVFDDASNVGLTGFTITGGPSAGVIIQNGSANIRISSNTVEDSAIGVWLGNGAAGGDTISGNTITGNALFGIGVSEVVNPAGQATTISGNMVSDNGSHGIELEGSNFVVQDNVVLQNGQTVAGSSGIHVYASGPGDLGGEDNVITGNLVAGTNVVGTVDGNGIELDQWTSGNTVSGNTICGNDGSGITLYDLSGNTISGNLVFCKDAAPNENTAADGEIVLASSLGLTNDNAISGNLFAGISPYAPVASVDTMSSALGNIFSANVMEDFGAAAMYDWAGIAGGSASFWRTVTGGTDQFAGVMPADNTGNNGAAYSFDCVFAASPLGSDFRFPWQTGVAYGGA